jgi:ATP synthase protein I
MNDEEKEKNSIMLSVAPYLTLGAQLAATVIAFFFIGKYCDEYFGTMPWLMVTLTMVGVVGGMIKFFQTVIELGKKEENERRGKI